MRPEEVSRASQTIHSEAFSPERAVGGSARSTASVSSATASIISQRMRGLMNDTRKALTPALTALLVAFGGASLGVTMAPSSADASSANKAYTGYSCYGSDSCHEGSALCCTDNFGGTGHCSTMCDGGTGG
jgi:hypothetical protein